jgi:hypothetical protein
MSILIFTLSTGTLGLHVYRETKFAVTICNPYENTEVLFVATEDEHANINCLSFNAF